jgi:hypothetical protein
MRGKGARRMQKTTHLVKQSTHERAHPDKRAAGRLRPQAYMPVRLRSGIWYQSL